MLIDPESTTGDGLSPDVPPELMRSMNPEIPGNGHLLPHTSARLSRTPLMRSIHYSLSSFSEEAEPSAPGQCVVEQERMALSMNFSSGGMLLLMDQAPHIPQVMRLRVPTPAEGVTVPTLAEACWSRRLPFPGAGDLHLVGVRFLL